MEGPITQFRLSINDLNDKSIFINWTNKERKYIFEKSSKNMSLRKLAGLINHDSSTLCDIKNGNVKPPGKVYLSLCNIAGLNPRLDGLNVSSRNYSPVKIISAHIEPELLGLLHSDGILRKHKRKGINFFFCNQNKQLIKRFKMLMKKSFSCKCLEFKDNRDETNYVFPPSVIGRLLINRFGEKRGIFLPPKMSDPELSGYVRGLFDGDGTILLKKTGKQVSSRIKIVMKHKLFAEHISSLLGRIGIYARMQFETSNGNSWWNIDIARKESILNFIKKIGSFHPKKKKRMECVLKYSGSLFPVV